MAPNVFHIGVKERVSVSVFDAGQPVTVKLYLQDYPHRRKTFSHVQGVVEKGELKLKTQSVKDKHYISLAFLGLLVDKPNEDLVQGTFW